LGFSPAQHRGFSCKKKKKNKGGNFQQPNTTQKEIRETHHHGRVSGALAEREAYGVGRLNETVAEEARQLVLGRERDDEVARRRVILVPKREVGGRVQWLELEWSEE